jgi:DNA-binding GntR family transcriptional regulator
VVPDEKNSRTLLRERVRGELTRAILEGTLQPGQRLRDDELIAWLGTSRAPIREALTHLAEVGLVEMAPNRFTRVATISPRLYADIAAVWGTLLTRGLYWAIQVFPVEDVPVLEELVDELRGSDPSAYPPGPTVIDRFLALILVHCRNRVLLDNIRVHDPVLQLGVNSFKGFLPPEPIADFFEEVVRRCRSHDVVGFEREMRAFLSGPMRAFVDSTAAFVRQPEPVRSLDARPPA